MSPLKSNFVFLSAVGVILNEGDILSFYVSHNELASALITSNSLYSATIVEY